MLPSSVRKLMLVLGTRPEAIKMAPVYRELATLPGVELVLVSTGQHGAMLDEALALFGLRPDHDLGLLSPGATLPQMLAGLLAGMEPLLARERPDLVLVHGDTLTSFGAALACFYAAIPVGHVEAGLRTRRLDAPFPEEAHRQMVARLASWHFAPTEEARDNLLRDGVARERIVVTGSTAVDALEAVRATAAGAPVPGLAPGQELVVVTLHRRETGVGGMRGLLQAIRTLARRHPERLFLYPVHPSPRLGELAHEILGRMSNVLLSPPLGYRDFVAALERASLILTDSGGIQEEAAHLGRPVLLLRDTTERPEAVTSGAVRLVGTSPQALVAAFEAHSRGAPVPRAAPYLPGSASRRIATAIAAELPGRAA